MQWISTASQKIDERLYRVCVWVKKYHADAINRVVLTVDLSKARHDPDEDQVRAELLCGHYFLLRMKTLRTLRLTIKSLLSCLTGAICVGRPQPRCFSISCSIKTFLSR